jgi:hypothetical protein
MTYGVPPETDMESFRVAAPEGHRQGHLPFGDDMTTVLEKQKSDGETRAYAQDRRTTSEENR